MGKILLLSRQIHRVCLWAVLLTGGTMGITGTMMKFKLGGFLVRQIHGNAGPFFNIAFVIMAVTGLILYFGPALVQFSKKD